LGAVQLGVRRHGGEARVPDAVERLEIVRRVLRRDHDALARLEAERAQRARQPRRTAGEVAVVAQDASALPDRGPRRMGETRAMEPGGEFHAVLYAGITGRREHCGRSPSPACGEGEATSTEDADRPPPDALRASPSSRSRIHPTSADYKCRNRASPISVQAGEGKLTSR